MAENKNMVQSLNNIIKHIQLTLETQINNDLNFFGLIVTVINKEFDFTIYRKPI